MHQNKGIIRSDQDSDHPKHSRNNVLEESPLEFRSVSSYTKKVATRNIKTLASCSEELLEGLIDVFFDSPPEKSSCLKVFHLHSLIIFLNCSKQNRKFELFILPLLIQVSFLLSLG